MKFFTIAGFAKGLSISSFCFAASKSWHNVVKLQEFLGVALRALVIFPFAFLPISEHFKSASLSVKARALLLTLPGAVRRFTLSDLGSVSIERFAALFAAKISSIFVQGSKTALRACRCVPLFDLALTGVKRFFTSDTVSRFSCFLQVFSAALSRACDRPSLLDLRGVSIEFGVTNRTPENLAFTHR